MQTESTTTPPPLRARVRGHAALDRLPSHQPALAATSVHVQHAAWQMLQSQRRRAWLPDVQGDGAVEAARTFLVEAR